MLRIKHFLESEGEISNKDLTVRFLNRAAPMVPVHKEMSRPKERKCVKVEAPFSDEISK